MKIAKYVWLSAVLGSALALAPGSAAAAPGTAISASPADADAPLAAARAALAAIGNHDAAGFGAIVLPEAIFLAQGYAADGTLTTRIIPQAQLTAMIADRGRQLSEQLFDPVVQVQGDLAHVWTPYTFDVGGQRSHCGIDSFGLARIDGVWRITSLTWTQEPKGCAKWGK